MTSAILPGNECWQNQMFVQCKRGQSNLVYTVLCWLIHLYSAGISHRPVVLGFVDREGGLRRVCGSIRVCHCQTGEEVKHTNLMENRNVNNSTTDLNNRRGGIV